MSIFDEAIEVAKNGKRFIVITHVNPEGDALGSMLGLTLALRDAGKEVFAFTEEGAPEPYGFLPGMDTAVHTLKDIDNIDATFATDCGQLSRLGEEYENFEGKGTIVNLDHHKTNDNFGDINIVHAHASAAGEVVYDFLRAGGFEISKDVATNLYVAIHTDTGSFRYSSSTAEAFRKAGELVELGADPREISMRVYESYPAVRFELMGLVLQTLKMHVDGRVASLVLTDEMLRTTGAKKELADGFVNFARAIKGVDVGILIREAGDGICKASLRSKKEVDVASVAESFGGGGHTNAAGAALKGGITEVRDIILEAVGKELNS